MGEGGRCPTFFNGQRPKHCKASTGTIVPWIEAENMLALCHKTRNIDDIDSKTKIFNPIDKIFKLSTRI